MEHLWALSLLGECVCYFPVHAFGVIDLSSVTYLFQELSSSFVEFILLRTLCVTFMLFTNVTGCGKPLGAGVSAPQAIVWMRIAIELANSGSMSMSWLFDFLYFILRCLFHKTGFMCCQTCFYWDGVWLGHLDCSAGDMVGEDGVAAVSNGGAWVCGHGMNKVGVWTRSVL